MIRGSLESGGGSDGRVSMSCRGLVNIVRSDMSFVGSAPGDRSRAHRLWCGCRQVSVGQIGIDRALANQRAQQAYAERVAFDVQYVAERSIRLDLAILLKTAKVLALQDGK